MPFCRSEPPTLCCTAWALGRGCWKSFTGGLSDSWLVMDLTTSSCGLCGSHIPALDIQWLTTPKKGTVPVSESGLWYMGSREFCLSLCAAQPYPLLVNFEGLRYCLHLCFVFSMRTAPFVELVRPPPLGLMAQLILGACTRCPFGLSTDAAWLSPAGFHAESCSKTMYWSCPKCYEVLPKYMLSIRTDKCVCL